MSENEDKYGYLPPLAFCVASVWVCLLVYKMITGCTESFEPSLEKHVNCLNGKVEVKENGVLCTCPK